MTTILIVDNSYNQSVKMFFPKLIRYLDDTKVSYVIVKGDKCGLQELKKILKAKSIDVGGIILTGSPLMLSVASKDDYITNIYCLKNLSNVPILGICFGCQLINMYYGGELVDLGKVYCETFEVFDMNTEGKGTRTAATQEKTLKAKFCCRYLPSKVPKSFVVVKSCLFTKSEKSTL
jgi:anthranilate/para-aminobenzoate synthase component II